MAKETPKETLKQAAKETPNEAAKEKDAAKESPTRPPERDESLREWRARRRKELPEAIAKEKRRPKLLNKRPKLDELRKGRAYEVLPPLGELDGAKQDKERFTRALEVLESRLKEPLKDRSAEFEHLTERPERRIRIPAALRGKRLSALRTIAPRSASPRPDTSNKRIRAVGLVSDDRGLEKERGKERKDVV